ncbi:haloacid dehalogenase-like hydrolase [Strigomonas culicis]|uniref:Haloacid dehalogenase-like hydrolase n=1 Tax=Strigomonas culicis TaxID=28005 RepID=S9VF74_9TRYP|nr:haloacid dehalogenase-like hydrolase [Strigomonas culicis]|eukprot:EPY25686.1 haloacid dehalogenase-like hydrolase [Strigomonas culicis]
MSKPPIRAIFADLDGTLFNHTHLASEYTAKVLNTLHHLHHHPAESGQPKEQHKVYFIVATGRPYEHVQYTLEASHLQADFVIANNGALVYNRAREPIQQHFLPPSVVRQLLRVVQAVEAGLAFNPKEVATNIFKGPKWYTDNRIEGLGRAYPAEFQPEEVAGLADHFPEAELNDVPQLFFRGPNQELLQVEAQLRQTLATDGATDAQVVHCFSYPFLLDVAPANVTKSTAVAEVLAYINDHLCQDGDARVERANVAAFGDGLNDLHMLREAGHPYIVKNGVRALKAALPDAEVLPFTNEEDAVARKIVDLCQLEEYL